MLSVVEEAKMEISESTVHVLFKIIFPDPGAEIGLFIRLFPFFNKHIKVENLVLFKSTRSKPG